jgi:hypothetical protein
MDHAPTWLRNRLLLALPARSLRRLLPELRPIQDILMEAGATVIGPAGTVAAALALVEGERLDGAILDYRLSDGTSLAS